MSTDLLISAVGIRNHKHGNGDHQSLLLLSLLHISIETYTFTAPIHTIYITAGFCPCTHEGGLSLDIRGKICEIASIITYIEEVGLKVMKGKRADISGCEVFYASSSFQVSIEWWG